MGKRVDFKKVVELKGLDISFDEDILPDDAIEKKKDNSKDEWKISNFCNGICNDEFIIYDLFYI